ncbi:MAG: endonuclease/exonuclease/phosphatase, partial [Sediminibacterium sp.]
MKKCIIIFGLLAIYAGVNAQTKKYRVCVIAFYNLENFYDTINNPLVNDDDFTPAGIKHYSKDIYTDKVAKLATVISQIGIEVSSSGPAIIGVA